MIDIFVQKDVCELLRNKTVVFMGDSNIRALYKDLLCLCQQTRFISNKVLKTKMEDTCFGDKLMMHGPKTNARSYREERLAFINNSKISFYFLTCVYDTYVKEILDYITDRSNTPDVMIINSCLWDVTRWGPTGVESFKKNLVKLMEELKRRVPDCLVIWVTAPPIACELKGGFLVKELEFLKYSLRFHVMEANYYARKVVVDHGFDLVDSHYHLKMQLHRREHDGIHWLPNAVRYITNLLLTHISIAWNVPLPHRYKSEIMEENSEYIQKETSAKEQEETSEKQYDNIKKKPISKISSVIEKPANFEFQSPKVINEKENSNSKTPKRKRKKSGKQKKLRFQESHHAYLQRVEKHQRNKRIKHWESSTPKYSPPRSVGKFHVSREDNILYYQNNSGYFPTPQTPLLSTSHCHYDKPVCYSSSIDNRPLLPDPYYPYQNTYTSLSSVPGYYAHSRQVVMSSTSRPYIFPNINTQNLQPVINFSCDVPLSFQF